MNVEKIRTDWLLQFQNKWEAAALAQHLGLPGRKVPSRKGQNRAAFIIDLIEDIKENGIKQSLKMHIGYYNEKAWIAYGGSRIVAANYLEIEYLPVVAQIFNGVSHKRAIDVKLAPNIKVGQQLKPSRAIPALKAYVL